MSDSMLISTEILKALKSLADQSQTLSPSEGNGFGFGLTVILGVVVLLIVGGAWIIKKVVDFLKTLYNDYKAQREKENQDRKEHGKRVEKQLEEIGLGLGSLNDITALHEREIAELKVQQALQGAELSVIKSTLKPPP